jgi:glycosyltransferase involved in cell wall biosynthesis
LKKIALYTESFPPKSGGVAVAQYNIYHLLKNEYDIKVFVYYEDLDFTDSIVIKRKPSKWLFGVLKKIILFYLKRISKTDNFHQTLEIFKTQLSIGRLNKHLKAFNPDYILIPDHYLPIRSLKKPNGSKLFWGAHHNYSRFTNNPLTEIAGWADIHVCQNMEKKASIKADVSICPSNYMVTVFKTTLREDIPVCKIYNFMVPELLNNIEPSVLPKFLASKRIVYMPSAGSSVKGKRYIFEIVRRLSVMTNGSIGFYLSGTIPSDLKFELDNLKEASIYCPGHLSWEGNLAIVKSCYLGITPNLVENFSYAILEAQTVGVPFVAFDTGGNKEMIENEITGYIVPYIDIEGIIKQTILLLENENKRNKMGELAKKKCNTTFHPDVIREQYLRLLN